MATSLNFKPEGTSLPELKPVELLVLVELLACDRHGYGIVRAIEESTKGAVRLVPGNLYRVLQRLIARNFIEESPYRPPAERDDERRRYYRITPAGRRVARSDIESHEALAIRGRSAIGSRRGSA